MQNTKGQIVDVFINPTNLPYHQQPKIYKIEWKDTKQGSAKYDLMESYAVKMNYPYILIDFYQRNAIFGSPKAIINNKKSTEQIADEKMNKQYYQQICDYDNVVMESDKINKIKGCHLILRRQEQPKSNNEKSKSASRRTKMEQDDEWVLRKSKRRSTDKEIKK